MKTKKTIIYSIIASFIISIALFSCNKDEDPGTIQKGEVEFGFNLKEITGNKSAKAVAAEPAALIVSIKDASGTFTYDTEEIELYNMNGYYISKPLSLLVGNYTLEKFLVVDAQGNVIYASPLESSDLAYLVNDPLPIDFTVSKDETLKLVPEVLSTENLTPEDFGYTTFSFDVVKTFDFLMSVFVYNETAQNYELTDAMLSIAATGNIIYSDTLAAITNQIKINDGFDSYILTVVKEGYTTYVDTFSNAELKLYFSSEDNGPLVVILENGEIAIGQPCPGAPTVTDADGNVYPTVQIGDQCWMAENLKTTKFNDGTIIPVIEDTTGVNISTPAYSWYDNDKNIYGDTYGALYNGYSIISKRLCPTGWHIPTDPEWTNFAEYLGGENVAGAKLKEEGSSHWYENNPEANDEVNFTALPAGRRNYNDGSFAAIFFFTAYWSSTDDSNQNLWVRIITNGENDLHRDSRFEKSYAFSVRCIKN